MNPENTCLLPESQANYFTLFFQDKSNVLVLAICITIAAFLLIIVKNSNKPIKDKIKMLYAHILFLIFPFIYILFNKACEQQIYSCDLKTFAIGLPAILGGLLITIVTTGYFLIPLFYRKNGKRMDDSNAAVKIKQIAEKMGWDEPSVYAIDTAKPKAFAFSHLKPSIFISVGLWELLSQKELEAVMLHELWHTNSNSASFKVSAIASKFLSPLSGFSSLTKQMEKEELNADEFAVKIQGTKRFLNSAKNKIENFE